MIATGFGAAAPPPSAHGRRDGLVRARPRHRFARRTTSRRATCSTCRRSCATSSSAQCWSSSAATRMAAGARLCDDCAHGADRSHRRRPPELPRDRAGAARGRGVRRSSARRRTAPRRSSLPAELRPRARAARRAAARPERLRGRGRARSANGSAPAVVLVSSRDAADYGDLIAECGARGFIPKAELSGAASARSLRLSRRAIALAFVAAVALAEAALALALILTRDHELDTRRSTAALAVTAGLSFVVAGLIALHRRPENRTGVYLAAVGYLWFFGALQDANNDVVFTLGEFARELRVHPVRGARARVPTGRLAPWPDAAIVRIDVWFVLVGRVAAPVREAPARLRGECPTSAIVVVRLADARRRRRRRRDALVHGRPHRRRRRRARPPLAAGDAPRAPDRCCPCTRRRRDAARCCCSRTCSSQDRAVDGPSVLSFRSSCSSPRCRSRSCSASCAAGSRAAPSPASSSRSSTACRCATRSPTRSATRRSGSPSGSRRRPVRRPRRPPARPARAVPDQSSRVVERDGRRVGALLHDESLARRARARRERLRRGRVRARQRAAPGRAAGAERAAAHDRRARRRACS